MVSLRTLAGRRDEIIRAAQFRRMGNVRVFGSVARGEHSEASDVDFLVSPLPDCSLFDLGGLIEDLHEMLGCKIDVVTEPDLKPAIRKRVLQEAIAL